jgi:hypothetical protein
MFLHPLLQRTQSLPSCRTAPSESSKFRKSLNPNIYKQGDDQALQKEERGERMVMTHETITIKQAYEQMDALLLHSQLEKMDFLTLLKRWKAITETIN